MMKINNSNNIVDIIATAGKVNDPETFPAVAQALEQWGFQARFGNNLLGDHPFLANTTANRFQDLIAALYADDSDIICCYRGGSGSSELLPYLQQLTPPTRQKIFVGFSDITALLIFLNQHWSWITFHGPGAKQLVANRIDQTSLDYLQQLFTKQLTKIHLPDLKALNTAAKSTAVINAPITGGNLTVICHLLGTPFQPQTANKILLLEDINEPAYKIRRMLTHLQQAGVFNQVAAILFGSLYDANYQQQSLIDQEILEFATSQTIPVFQTSLIGHNSTNYVIPFGQVVEFDKDKGVSI